MDSWLVLLQVAGGLGALLFGGDILIRGVVRLAGRLRLSTRFLGLTLVAFGTSSPELVVSLQAARQGQMEISAANVIGSNIFNILGVLGLAALIRPIACRPVILSRDGVITLAASMALAGAGWLGGLSRPVGVLFLAGLGLFILSSLRSSGRGPTVPETPPRTGTSLPAALVMVAAGFAALILGGRWFLEGSVALARLAGLSEAVIGLTLVAGGTSMPELAASAVASWRRESDIAVGNVLGSNIFNILGILGLTGALYGLPLTGRLAGPDMWIMAATAAVLLPFLFTGWRLSRWEGGLLLTGLGAYWWAVLLT